MHNERPTNFDKLKAFAAIDNIEDAALALDSFPCSLCGYYSERECLAPKQENNNECIEGRKLWLREVSY